MAEDDKSLIKSTSYEPLASLPPQVEKEARAAAARVGDAYAASTKRAYRAAWRIFEGWCAKRTIPIGAVTPEILVTYLEWRLQNGLGPRACVREYGAVAAHLREIHPNGPWLAKAPPEILRRWLKGAKKLAVPAVGKKPLLPAHFEKLSDLVRVDPARWVESARDRALLLFGFAGGFRRSELVALDVADLRFGPDGVIALLKRSKTDQEGQGRAVAVWRQQGRRCAVAALEAYLRGARIEAGPLFQRVRGGQVTGKRLYDRAVALIVKKAIASLGLDPKEYAGHSLRCGFVSAASARGASIDEIMNTTGHRRADQVIGYIRRATPFDRNASKGLLEGGASTTEESPVPPAGFEDVLGRYEVIRFDMGCGQPLSWGFRLLKEIPGERFEALSAHGWMECLSPGRWALAIKRLTPADARVKYGEVTAIERGPRGGFRAITYGTQRFLARELLPDERIPPTPEPETELTAIVACGRGHVHKEQHVGKLCCAGECGEHREDKETRRIARREMPHAE